MNIGIFTDSYFPQVSGVATSIKTLKDDLERKGHQVYIFTTTDPHVPDDAVEPNLFRFTSVPFVSLPIGELRCADCSMLMPWLRN